MFIMVSGLHLISSVSVIQEVFFSFPTFLFLFKLQFLFMSLLSEAASSDVQRA